MCTVTVYHLSFISQWFGPICAWDLMQLTLGEWRGWKKDRPDYSSRVKKKKGESRWNWKKHLSVLLTSLGILGVKIIPKDTGTYILIPAKNIIMLRYIPTACCLDSWLSFPHAPGEDTSRSISPPEHG